MKGEFSDSLVVEYIDGPNPFKIRQGFTYTLDTKLGSMQLRVPLGMEYDGTSMPVGTRWLIRKSDPELLQCAAGHDAGFREPVLLVTTLGRLVRRRATRQEINLMMAAMMRTKNVSRWKRVLINAGLAVGSKGPWDRCRERYD